MEFVLLVVWVLSTWWAMNICRDKGRDPGLGLLLGVCLGFIGTAICALLAPGDLSRRDVKVFIPTNELKDADGKVHCRKCGSVLNAGRVRCWNCGTEQDVSVVPEPVAPPAAASTPVDTIAVLERLAALRAQGALTDAEFEAQKAKVLGETR